VDALILRALPVREPQGLAILTDAGRAPQAEWWTNPVWEQLRDRHVFEHAFV